MGRYMVIFLGWGMISIDRFWGRWEEGMGAIYHYRGFKIPRSVSS